MCRLTVEQAGGANVCAFLDTVKVSEVGKVLIANPATDDGYRVLVGSTPDVPLLMHDYADHPRIYNRAMNSDAAGGYQIMGRWWPHYKTLLKLPDFGPESQDRYAVQQIRESRALNPLLAGDFETAIRLCAHIWASFPGANYSGQRMNKLTYLQDAYERAGGMLRKV